MLSRETVAFLLDDIPATERAAAVLALLPRAGDFSLAAADALADALEEAAAVRSDKLLDDLGQETPLRHYLAARLLWSWGNRHEGIERLAAAIAGHADPGLKVLQSRWLASSGRPVEALRSLRLALHQHPPYSAYPRLEKLVERLVQSPEWTPRRRVRVGLLGSMTTALLAPVLRASLLRDGIAAEVYEGAFGSFRQEVLDPASGLQAFKPDLVVILLQHRDLAPSPSVEWTLAAELLADLQGLWRTLAQRLPCHIIQSTIVLPRGGSWGSLEHSREEGRLATLNRFNSALVASRGPGVSMLDLNALYPCTELDSQEEWDRSKQFPRAEALPVLAEALAAQIRAVLGLSSKVLVTDLDNTLWRGVIGEDGLEGIRIGPPSAEGEGHAALQRYLSELRARGVVLAVCSKNNPADAEAPFQKHDGMVLTLRDFASFRANWDDKAANLRALASELALGLDSFVFLDDNPFERNLVRQELPDVIVPEVSADPWSMLRALQRGQYFEAISLTDEDLRRSASYEATAAIRRVQSGPASALDDFLQGLGMVCEHGPVGAVTLDRVTQLINKTNQFNLTTRRYTLEQVRTMAASHAWWCHWFKLSDRQADHGLVGVLLAEVGASTWKVDSWLMSCRVLGRRLEDFMASCLLDAAAKAGAREVRARYLPTEKNGMVADLLPRLGFEPAGDEHRALAASRPALPWILDKGSS